MEKKIKLIHIITHLPVGGAQDNTLYTLELLDKKKYDIYLCCNLNGELVNRAKGINQIKLINVPYLQREVNLFNDIYAFIKIFKIIKKGSFDIIHTHSSKAGFIGRIAAKLNDVPLVIHTVHGFPFNDFMFFIKKHFFIYIEKLLSKWTDALITVSNLNKQKIIDLKISEESKIHNIYSGIDLNLFEYKKDLSFRKKINISNEKILIGSVGRLSYQKDPMIMVDAFKIISDRFPNAHLVLIGDGILMGAIVERLNELNLNEKVHLTGNISSPWEVYRSLDLFIMSSIYEGLGRSITEAMCCGVPVVCTAVEGVPEIVKDGITGLLVMPKDIEGLARSIIECLENMEDAKKRALEGQKFVNDNFSVIKMVEDIDNLYRELI